MIIIIFSSFYYLFVIKNIVNFTFLISDYIWLKVNIDANKISYRHQKISFILTA